MAFVVQACQESPTQNTNVFNPGEMALDAPPKLMHWGKIVGQWTCTEESLSSDGASWQPAGTSDWDFIWAYDGWGIQDNYYSPARSKALDDESTRQRGINLRIYNPTEKKWILTWLTTQSTAPLSITAVSDDEKIIMSSTVPNAQGLHSQYTFFDMSKNTFEWTLSQSKDEKNWTKVYKIHCKIKA